MREQPDIQTYKQTDKQTDIFLLETSACVPSYGEVLVGVRAGYRKRPISRGVPGALKYPSARTTLPTRSTQHVLILVEFYLWHEHWHAGTRVKKIVVVVVLLCFSVAARRSPRGPHDTRRCGPSVTPCEGSELARKRGPLTLVERPVVRASPGTPFKAISPCSRDTRSLRHPNVILP
ncbi:hypothetical protein DPMN_187438 [Dreissena polymorpha]|uniref:Uncharacterized protein n=1 Tax=Dreissena polymorpha TaxID=45954 RepID=A0A9D4DRK2_DREPO|nr:hypothetical protein DPMN_187438 [Dreissena polymorpha]